jgi:GTP-binding protein Era
MRDDGLERLISALAEQLPEGPSYYEDGQVTDKTERQIAGELIREKVILETRDELPYAVHVDVDSFEDERPKIVRIQATLVVERASQKPIVIGRKGERIKAIGIRARKELEHFLDAQVFLELHVRVQEGGTASSSLLADLGYSSARDDGALDVDDEGDDGPIGLDDPEVQAALENAHEEEGE